MKRKSDFPKCLGGPTKVKRELSWCLLVKWPSCTFSGFTVKSLSYWVMFTLKSLSLVDRVTSFSCTLATLWWNKAHHVDNIAPLTAFYCSSPRTKIFYCKYSSPLQLHYPQLRYFYSYPILHCNKKKSELSYFLLFSPPVKLFFFAH